MILVITPETALHPSPLDFVALRPKLGKIDLSFYDKSSQSAKNRKRYRILNVYPPTKLVRKPEGVGGAWDHFH